MGLFFEANESTGRSKTPTIPIHTARQLGCKVCPLAKVGNFSPDMPASGSEKPIIYILGEAPGCISGDSLIDTAFRDKSIYPYGIPISELVGKRDFFVYSYDLENERLALGKVNRVWRTGRKMTYKVTYDWKYAKGGETIWLRDSIIVTSNHPFLLRNPHVKHDPFKGLESEKRYLSIDEGLSVGHSIQPFNRLISRGRAHISTAGDGYYNEANFLLAHKIGRPLESGHRENCHHKDENPLNDSRDNLECLTVEEHARHHTSKDNPMHNPIHQVTHRKAVTTDEYRLAMSNQKKEYLSNPENHKKHLNGIYKSNESRSKKAKQHWVDEEYRKKQEQVDRSEIMTNLWQTHFNTPEHIEKIREGSKRRSANPHYYFNWLQGQQKRWGWTDEEVEKRFIKRFPDEPLPSNNHKIISIEPVGVQNVYDMEVESYHNFAVNGIFVHNSEEDKKGVQFVGKSGQLLRSHFPKEWEEHLRFNNTIRSRPPGNRDPEPIEIECCRSSVESDLAKTKPLVIIGVGRIPLSWAVGKPDIARWRARLIPVKIKDHVCWFYPIYHPAYILRQQRKSKKTGQVIKTQWDHMFKRDIDRVLDLIENKQLPTPIYIEKGHLDNIKWTEGLKSDRELEKVFSWLDKLLEEPYIGFDYETTHLRPYYENAKILTVAVGTHDRSYAFPMRYPNAWSPKQLEQLEAKFKDFLLRSGRKICHNLKFEQEWTAWFFGNECLRDTKWEDTMAQAYAIDERRGMLDLDTLIRVNFGFWLKSLSNLDRTRMIDYPLSKILPYNGLDAKWTFNLFHKQQEVLDQDERLEIVHKNLIRTSPTLTLAQKTGLVVNEKVRLKFDRDYSKQLAEIEGDIRILPEVKEYEERFHKRFRPSAPEQLLDLLRDVLGLEDEIKDKNDKYTTAEPVLKGLSEKVDVARMILEWRAIAKKKSTYIDPFPDFIFPTTGRIHTNYNPYVTTTGRLSSDSPNLQNIPNRKGKEIRSMFVAPKDHWIVGADYGQIEARIIGVVSQDQAFCEALWNNYDIHLHWAEHIAEAYPNVIGGRSYLGDKSRIKRFRKDVKNQWTFPAFYGSSPYSISNAIGVPIEIVLELFDEFWDMFKGVKKWHKWVIDRYEKLGYVETLTGRRRHAPLSINEVINSGIQGTASDICVDAMNRLSEEGIQVIMNVHDEIDSYVPDERLEEQTETIAEIMCSVPFKWINVPIAVEVSVGNDWYNMEEIGTFYSTNYIKVDKKMYQIGHYRDRRYV